MTKAKQLNLTPFERRVVNAELQAKYNFTLYKIKLGLFALIGYAVIFALLSTLVILAGGTLTLAVFSTGVFLLLVKKKIILVIILAIWVLLKSLWVKFDAPQGYELKKKQFPELFAQIDAIRKKLKAPAINKVILTPELNAAITQTPRFGLLGGHQNTLILGLELLLTLSPQEAKAVLAHEFGHLSGNHSRFSAWIYRVRITWQRIMQAYEHSDSFGAKITQRFFNWYAPRFAAYSFVLARNNEYEADAIAAELTSKIAATSALVNTHVTGPYVDENYWQWYFKKADNMPEPDHAPYEGLAGFLANNQPAKKELLNRIKSEMQQKTEYDDTHPALRDRIDAIGGEPVLPAPGSENVAQVWLGDKYSEVLRHFDSEWINNNTRRWRERYEYVVNAKAELAILEAKSMAFLSKEELWNLAVWTEELKDPKNAFEIYENFQKNYPDDTYVAFALGKMLYFREDESCLLQFKKSISNPQLVIRACQYAYYFLVANERVEEAGNWRVLAEKQIAIDNAANDERESVTVRDELVTARIDRQLQQQIVQQLQTHRKIKKSWLAQKAVQYYPEHPVYVIAFTAKGFYLSYDSVVAQVAATLDLPVTIFTVVKGGEYKALAKKIIRNGRRII